MRANKQVYILLSCWFLVNGFLFYSLGITYAIDTTRFDVEANTWINGSFEPSHRLWYFGYIAVLALCKSIFDSIYPSILLQYVLSACATVYFYKGLQKLLKNSQIAFCSTLFVIAYFPIQQWNSCLLTESMFISMVLFFVWALSVENNTRKWVALLGISILAASLRPNGGILVLTCFGMYGLQEITYNKKWLALLLIPLGMALFVLQNYTDTFYLFLLDSFNKGEIICEYASSSVPVTYITNDSSIGSISKIIDLVAHHPSKSIKLYFGRLIALWSDVRVYYSLTHNLFIGSYLFVAYSMAVIGWIQFRKIYTQLVYVTLLYCGLNSLLVMITYADWDGRFLAPLLPIIFIWSALGIYFSIQFLTRKKIRV